MSVIIMPYGPVIKAHFRPNFRSVELIYGHLKKLKRISQCFSQNDFRAVVWNTLTIQSGIYLQNFTRDFYKA